MSHQPGSPRGAEVPTQPAPPPGYWQASDGNWYPPEARTAPLATGPKKKRPWYFRWWAIALAVLLVLIVISAIAGGSSSNKTNTATTPSKSSSSANSSATATSAAAPSIHAIGDTAHTGDFDVSVTKVVEPYQPQNSFEAAHAGEHYVAIDVSARNTSNDQHILATAFFELTDLSGKKYGQTFLDNTQPIDGEVPPGQPRAGTLFYTVPDGVTGLVLRVRGDFTSGGTTFQIN